MAFRHLLATATLCPHDEQSELKLFREYVQPFNFSRGNDGVTFITPTYDRVRDSLDDGYASIVLRMASGARVNVSKLLLYTDDCLQVGMFGRGSACRACSAGGFCPGKVTVWWIEASRHRRRPVHCAGMGVLVRGGYFEHRHAHTRAMDRPSAMPR